MNNWKTKLFGDNRLNFYGWLVAMLVATSASCIFVLRAAGANGGRSATVQILIAIYLILMGHFAFAVHKYLARVAKRLDSPDDQQNDQGH
jgi:hypothetical protein